MTLACKHCGATTTKSGKPWPHRGALNLHETVHCKQKQGGGDAQMNSAAAKCCDKPSIRLLRVTDQRELYAMHQGYTKVCNNCEECSK